MKKSLPEVKAMENRPVRTGRTLPRSGELKQRLAAGGVSVGSWLQLAHPAHAEILAAAGFEWLVIDLEHSVITIREAEELVRIVGLSGIVPLVRVSSNDPVQIKRIMDCGAAGIIVPMVNTPAEAKRAVGSVRYPPFGQRGVGLARAQGYGADFRQHWDWLANDSLIFVQIEHADAVRNLDAIFTVEGIDGFFVGAYDLSGSLGVPGELEHPKMQNALKEIRSAAARHPAITPGFHVVSPDPNAVAVKIGEGYRFIAYSTDMILLQEASADGMRRITRALRG